MLSLVRELLGRVARLGGSRNQYVAESVDRPIGKALDIGCSQGWALAALRGCAQELWGLDTDEAALRQAQVLHPDIHFVNQSATALPFGDETYDVVILSEVIEHVGEKCKPIVVKEAHRVLKRGGLFVFTAPYAGLFAWMDPLDLKRRLPSIYRLYARYTGYEPQTPACIGHKHLSLDEIQRLFAGKFSIEEVRYCGLLVPILTCILTVGSRLHLLPQRIERAMNRLCAWESGVSYGPRLAFDIRIRARKPF